MTTNQRMPIIAGIVMMVAGAYVVDCGNYPLTGIVMMCCGLVILIGGPIVEGM